MTNNIMHYQKHSQEKQSAVQCNLIWHQLSICDIQNVSTLKFLIKFNLKQVNIGSGNGLVL